MAVQDEVPKSRLTIKYETEINGEPAPKELPFRMMIPGDFSLGTSKDRKTDLSERKARNFDGSNTSEVMKDMDISLDMVVPNKVNPETAESLRVNLKMDSMDAFSPEAIARQVPQLRSLVLLKELLQEMQSNIANRKEFAVLLRKLYSNPKAIESIKEKLKAPVLPKRKEEEKEE